LTDILKRWNDAIFDIGSYGVNKEENNENGKAEGQVYMDEEARL
jgi:hypothetical protein